MDFDIEAFNGITQGIRSIGGTVRDLAGAFSAYQSAVQPAEGRSDADVEAAAKQVTLAMKNAELNNVLLEAQIEVLMQKVREAQKAEAKLENYRLYRTPAGGLVYAIGDPVGEVADGHFICPDCYEDGRRAILQIGNTMGSCGRCNRLFSIYAEKPVHKPNVGWMGS